VAVATVFPSSTLGFASPDAGLGSERRQTFQALVETLSGEALLRRCRAFRQLGERLGDPQDGTPFVDSDHMLVSAETGRATMQVLDGYSSPRGWVPARPPGDEKGAT
jgi:hypothetical protein